MGQNESTLNPNLPKQNHLATEPISDLKPRLQNQENFYSLNTRGEHTPLNMNYQPSTTTKSPINKPRVFNNENKPLKEQYSYLSEQKSVNTASRSRMSYSSRPGMNQVKRRNSEDFDADMMEENSNTKNQNTNILDNSEAVVSSVNSKADSLFKAALETKNNSGNNSFYTNKSITNSQSIQPLQKNQLFQNRPVQRSVLAVKHENMQEDDTQAVEDENSAIRKQTFGKENNVFAPTDYRPSAAIIENRYLNDEVKIMDTGFSSSRKMDSDREGYDQSPALSARLQEELPINIIEQAHNLVPPNFRATPSSSTQSMSYQSILKKPVRIESKELAQVPEEASRAHKLSQNLLDEDFQNPSPNKNKPSTQRDSKGFPDAEFSFKPSNLSREKPRYSIENNSIQVNEPQVKVLRKSKSQVQVVVQKKNLPAIQIVESESASSSYADGPVSTESASSISSARRPYMAQNAKKRTHSNTNVKSAGRSRALDYSSNYGISPYTNKSYVQGSGNSFHAQNFHSLPHAPIMNTVPSMPALHTVPVMPPMEAYPYLVNQHAYFGNGGFPPQISTPMRNNYPYYYQNIQATPPVGTMPVGVFSSPQFYNPLQGVHQTNNYTQNMASPSPSNYLGHGITEHGRQTPHRDSSYMIHKGPDSARGYYQGYDNLSGNYASRPVDYSVENTGYKGLRSSKSLSNLKVGRCTPTHEMAVGVSRMSAAAYQNHSFTNNQVDSFSKDAGQGALSQVNNRENSQNMRKENVSDIGKIVRAESGNQSESTNVLDNRALNETTISRINEISRTRKPVYQEESEGGQELNTTEYSLVQKLEGNGREASTKTLSIKSSPSKKGKETKPVTGRKNWQMLNKIGSANVSEKENEAMVFSSEPSQIMPPSNKAQRKGKIDLLLGNNNGPSAWEARSLSNKTPDIPKPKSYNQVLVFDPPKCRTSQSSSKPKSAQLQQSRIPENRRESETQEMQKGVKLCFDFADETDDADRKNGEDSVRAGDRSIAEYFKQRKQSLFNKLEEENRRFSTASNNQTKEIGKEELVQKRKEMMKSSKKGQVLDTVSSGAPTRELTQNQDISNIGFSGFSASPIEVGKRTDTTMLSGYSSNMVSHASRRNTKELNGSLMERLVQGQKIKISKKDMIALTAKNYHNLPEVKKKKDEKKKKEERLEELKKRQEKVKDLDARLRRPKSTKRIPTSEGGSQYMS